MNGALIDRPETWLIRAHRRLANERGISLIMVAMLLLVLTAMTSFVLDFGVMWLSRSQAQNAADAGALAGINSLAVDDRTWPAPANGVVVGAATTAARANRVFGAIPGTVVTSVCPSWMTAPTNINCIQVDVYRDGTNASTVLPVYFAQVVGVTSQRVKATATAQVIAANTSGCMRPWFIPERYNEVGGGAGFQSPPDTMNAYKVPDDIGTAVLFHHNSAPSSYGTLDVGSGASAVANAIRHCVTDVTFSIGETVATEPGNMLGPVDKAIDDLLKWDPGATWDATKKAVVGGCSTTGTCSCSGPCPYGGTQSPRIVQAAICNPIDLDCSGDASGKGSIQITNILSFFITGCNDVIGSCNKNKGNIDINAILIGSGGLFEEGPTVGPGNSFITVQMLVR